MKSSQENQHKNSKKQRKSTAVVSCVVAFFALTLGTEFLGRYTGRQETVHALDHVGPGSAQLTAPTAPRIQSICFSPSGKSSVYVKGLFAGEGDIVDGFRILKIYPNSVEFEKDGKIVKGYVFSASKTQASQESEPQQQAVYTSSDDSQIQNEQPAVSNPIIAEMGSYYSRISQSTGRSKTVDNKEYHSKDGTYLRSHFQSPNIPGSTYQNGNTYLVTGEGHRIKGKSDSGNFIQIGDCVLLQVNPVDRVVCILCLGSDDDIVIGENGRPGHPRYLVNTDDMEKVEAKLISE